MSMLQAGPKSSCDRRQRFENKPGGQRVGRSDGDVPLRQDDELWRLRTG